MFFVLWADEYIYRQLFEDGRKLDFVVINEYPETVNGAYKLLVHKLKECDESILRVGRQKFRSEHGHGVRTSDMFKQERGR